MYIVHCRVIVDNMCEFKHSSSHVDCNFDARLVSKTRKYRSTKKLRKHVCQLILVKQFKASKLGQLQLDQSEVSKRSPTARVQSQPGPDTTSICSLRHHAFMGIKVFANPKLGVSQFTKFRTGSCHCFASCHYFASFDCCHDPFIVRSMVSRIPILQTCNVVVVLKQRLASLQICAVLRCKQATS